MTTRLRPTDFLRTVELPTETVSTSANKADCRSMTQLGGALRAPHRGQRVGVVQPPNTLAFRWTTSKSASVRASSPDGGSRPKEHPEGRHSRPWPQIAKPYLEDEPPECRTTNFADGLEKASTPLACQGRVNRMGPPTKAANRRLTRRVPRILTVRRLCSSGLSFGPTTRGECWTADVVMAFGIK